MSDPAVWGPILVAAVVFFSGYLIDRRIEAAMDQQRDHHNRVMEVLNSLPDELDQLKTYLNFIDQNTQPPSDID